MAKTTYIATCPFTGEQVTRKSDHAYTHALAVKVTLVLEPVPGSQDFMVKRKGQAPAGYVITRQPGRACWGHAFKAQPIPVERQETKVYGIVSFHHSEKLAQAAAHSMEWGGMRRIEFVVVPCVPAVKAAR